MHIKSFSSTYKFFLLLLILEETENLLHPYKSHGPGPEPRPPAPTLASGTSRSWLLEVGSPAAVGLRFLCTVTQHAAIRAGRASAAHRKIASFFLIRLQPGGAQKVVQRECVSLCSSPRCCHRNLGAETLRWGRCRGVRLAEHTGCQEFGRQPGSPAAPRMCVNGNWGRAMLGDPCGSASMAEGLGREAFPGSWEVISGERRCDLKMGSGKGKAVAQGRYLNTEGGDSRTSSRSQESGNCP